MSAKKRKIFPFGLLLYPRFQMVLIFFNVGIFIAALGGIGLQFYFTIESFKDLASKSGLEIGHPFYSFLDMKINQFNFWLLVGVVVSIIFNSFATLYLSHRIVGPVYRLQKYFLEVKEKEEVLPLAFRKNDYFLDLPILIVNALTVLRNKSSSGKK